MNKIYDYLRKQRKGNSCVWQASSVYGRIFILLIPILTELISEKTKIEMALLVNNEEIPFIHKWDSRYSSNMFTDPLIESDNMETLKALPFLQGMHIKRGWSGWLGMKAAAKLFENKLNSPELLRYMLMKNISL